MKKTCTKQDNPQRLAVAEASGLAISVRVMVAKRQAAYEASIYRGVSPNSPRVHEEWFRLAGVARFTQRGNPILFHRLMLKHVYQPMAREDAYFSELLSYNPWEGYDYFSFGRECQFHTYLERAGKGLLERHLTKVLDICRNATSWEGYLETATTALDLPDSKGFSSW